MVIEFFFNNCMILKFQNIMTFLDKPIIIQVGCQFLNTNTLYIYGNSIFVSFSKYGDFRSKFSKRILCKQ
jgi:hypothetical protein